MTAEEKQKVAIEVLLGWGELTWCEWFEPDVDELWVEARSAGGMRAQRRVAIPTRVLEDLEGEQRSIFVANRRKCVFEALVLDAVVYAGMRLRIHGDDGVMRRACEEGVHRLLQRGFREFR